MTSTGIDIQLCSDEDMPDCARAMSRGFLHDAPFFDIYFPEHDTPNGHAAASERLLKWKRETSHSYFLKAVQSSGTHSSPQIIGFAVWTHETQPQPSELAEFEDVEIVWPDLQDREYMTRLWRDYVIPRNQVIREAEPAGVFVLELLGVDARYQRQGAGTALVEWGTGEAKKRGLGAIVEATHVGRRTYEKCGFAVDQEEMRFDVGEEFQQRTKPLLLFMRRRAD